MIHINLNQLTEALENRGYTLLAEGETPMGVKTIIITHSFTDKWGGEHRITATIGSNGCAQVKKPNGTKKWYYKKTEAQMGAILRQTEEFYR